MSNYTPTTDEIRRYWVYTFGEQRPEPRVAAEDFDRWLTSVKEEAWYDGWEARADLGVQAACPDDHNPYRGNSLEANPDLSTKETT